MWHAWGRGEKFTGFWMGGTKARCHWEDLGVDNIKMDLKEIEIDEAYWIRLAQDTIHWRAFVNTVMNLRLP
jgi:hypothetical protein